MDVSDVVDVDCRVDICSTPLVRPRIEYREVVVLIVATLVDDLIFHQVLFIDPVHMSRFSIILQVRHTLHWAHTSSWR